MIAYKGFTKNLTAILGKGIYQFELQKTYKEKTCKCATNGFHCAENPLCILDYYSGLDSRYFIVDAAGDINQDGRGTRISCTELTLVKEITRIELAACACQYISNHPEREMDKSVRKGSGECNRKNDFIIVRGKHPQASGVKGSYLFLLKEEHTGKDIQIIYPVYVDGVEVKENTYYCLRGDKLCEKKN